MPQYASFASNMFVPVSVKILDHRKCGSMLSEHSRTYHNPHHAGMYVLPS
jgi:hypothetical protein